MNTTETNTDQETISRIAGRMVHRAQDITGAALATGYLEGIREQIVKLRKRRQENEDPEVTAQKLADLEDREARLIIAAADYKRAEAILRVFPALLWAAKAGYDQAAALTDPDVKNIAGLILRAVVAAEEALK